MYRSPGLILALAATVTLAACSTTPADLEAKTPPIVRSYSENYQEIYRRASSAAKRCIAEQVGPYAAMAVDSELYPDLGHGAITVSLINMGPRNYYLSTRIDKVGTGSRMTIHSGNTLASDARTAALLRWASGDPSC